ncbi:50S ribosomal protein L4 [Candidatus Roizmanbacteria bacterium CG_4_9_14_3_um_filter_33_18]|uniref:Large ribosomal subunit protein uL4 n=2 Tax=Candidatus Roizmaniibacteriota TaxID=1752723 RepID=A0A2M7UAK0_9BACT|nr:MAG: 50S ribosomal protein L4 [Candidatus Roizmanbacteria bacterium CG_4_10_14_0_2_um_filter_33_96]PJA55504.1 MAG: 50S ribosomal protein L4 [Candidatus Roizmanbacteria bacterium CG_4_9_14_3_um_filter_33_18]
MVEIKKVEKKSKLSLSIYSIDGKEQKTIELPKDVFAATENKSLLAQAVRVYLVNQRQGNVKVKTRSEVTGSTRKIYRQKGTGKARHGAIKAPIFVGGGIAHGPKQKDYNLKFNKKEKKLALYGALSIKLKEKKIFGLDEKALTMSPKTKTVANFLKVLKLVGKNNLMILKKISGKNNLVLAMRNISNISFVDVNSLNPYLILKSSSLIFVENALEVFNDKPKNDNK